MKKRVAIWTNGGIGAGLFLQGYPMLVKLVDALSRRHSIELFSVVSVPRTMNFGFEIHSPPTWLKTSPLRWLYLVGIFSVRNARNSFDSLLGFWGYPAGFVVTLLGKMFNRPSLINTLGAELADVSEINFGLLGRKASRKRMVWTLRNASAVVTISEFQAAVIRSLEITRDVKVIPWGADPALFSFMAKSWDELRILHVANLTEVKDQETLIRTFAEIRKRKPAHLRIVGADFMAGKIQELVHSLSLDADIEFTGAVPYDLVQPHYEWANIMIHTSLYEGQSMAVTEAAASGLLIAGTRVGILFDLGDLCTLGVERRQFNALADLIISTTDRREVCTQMVENARHWSNEHSFHWTVQQFDLLIQEVNR